MSVDRGAPGMVIVDAGSQSTERCLETALRSRRYPTPRPGPLGRFQAVLEPVAR